MPPATRCSRRAQRLEHWPVKNRICRYYRDTSIRLQLGYNSTLQLVRVQTDMNPYRTLKLPMLGVELYWAR